MSGPDSILRLTGLPPRTGATVAAIESAERDLGVRLPDDYREFLRESNGIEGFSGPNSDYLMLWGAMELGERNRGYHVREFASGLILIGSNGGGEAFGFVHRGGKAGYVRLPFIPMDLREAEDMGETLFGLVQRLRGAERANPPRGFDASRFESVRQALVRARTALPTSAERYRKTPADHPGGIGTLDGFDESMEQYEHEVALWALAAVGRAVVAPPEFWSALDDAGRLMGFDEAWRARVCRP